MMGLGNTQRGEKLPEAYCPASRDSRRATEFEKGSPKGGRLVVAGGRSGWLIRETGPRKKVKTCSPSLRTSEGNRGLVLGIEPLAVGCQLIQASGRRRAEG